MHILLQFLVFQWYIYHFHFLIWFHSALLEKKIYFITDLLTSLKTAIHNPVAGKTIYSLFCDASGIIKHKETILC